MTAVRPRTALLVAPAFFGYEQAIAAELAEIGYTVTYIDERPSNNALARALVRVLPSLMGGQIRRHYRRWSRKVEGVSYDLVVVVKGEVVPRGFLEQIRSSSPAARFVFYTFDALGNSPKCLELFDLFDERLSFDRADVERRSDLGYLPLFFTNEFRPLETGRSRQWDLAFIGTLHSARYQFMVELRSGSVRLLEFFYVPAKWYFYVGKLVTREFRTVVRGDVSFRSMGRDEVASAFRNSRAVLDIQRDGQTGLTMRTFEVLASGAILVTTNAAVRNEHFFDPSRVLVIPPELDDVKPAEVWAALQSMPDPGPMPAEFGCYGIRGWVVRVAGDEAT